MKLTSQHLVVSLGLMLTAGTAFAIPRSQAVLYGGNYAGGPAFDDALQLSAQALAANMALWGNWDWGNGLNNIDVLNGFGGAGAFTAALNPYQAGGARQLQAGDFMMIFYFGHGGFAGDGSPLDVTKFNENPPALTASDEYLAFADHSRLWDDQLVQELLDFNNGVYKLFVNISCFSGGFWGGNDEGDLEGVPLTAMMASSPETRTTLTGGLGPRPWEPLYLRNLIINAHPLSWIGTNFVSYQMWHARSVTAGSGIAGQNRFDEYDDLWDDTFTDDAPACNDCLPANFDLNLIAIGTPEPGGFVLFTAALGALAFYRRRTARR
jgi:hypothetical protein